MLRQRPEVFLARPSGVLRAPVLHPRVPVGRRMPHRFTQPSQALFEQMGGRTLLAPCVRHATAASSLRALVTMMTGIFGVCS
jgi:hypothetical protein